MLLSCAKEFVFMDNELYDLVNGWIKKADNDLKNARIILESNVEDKPYDTVCYHCQQATEKFLKGYLLFLEIEFPKTHFISTLIDLGLKKDSGLIVLMKADELTAYGTMVRYPDDLYNPTKAESIEAFEIALSVQMYVLQKIKI